MKHGMSVVELAEEIKRQSESKADYVADSRATAMVVREADTPTGEELAIEFGTNRGTKSLAVGPVAHEQIATSLGIPKRFYDHLAERHADLLAHNVTELMHREPKKRMLRTLDNRVRGYVSDRFRCLDNDDLAEAVFPVLNELGVRIVSCDITERRMYIKFVNPELRVDAPDLMPAAYGNPSDVIYAGEYKGFRMSEIAAGGVIGNSEVGFGALYIKDLDLNAWCANGCVRTTVKRTTHVGRSHARLEGLEASNFYSSSTQWLDDAALFAKLSDAVRGMFDRERFEARIDSYREAKADVIEAYIPEVVEVVAKKLALPEKTQASVLDALIKDGDLSRWGVANALTAVSQKVEDYDQASKLEELGGRVVELPKRDWSAIVRQAKKIAA